MSDAIEVVERQPKAEALLRHWEAQQKISQIQKAHDDATNVLDQKYRQEIADARNAEAEAANEAARLGVPVRSGLCP